MNSSALLAIVALAAVFVSANAFAPPQWANAGYAADGRIPFTLPKAAPQILFNMTYTASLSGLLSPVVDYYGNVYWVCDAGVYQWSPQTNTAVGPFAFTTGSVSQVYSPALSPDSKTIYVPATEGSKFRIYAMDIRKLIDNLGNATLAQNWVWVANSSHSADDNFDAIFVDGERIFFGSPDTAVALVDAATGTALVYVDTADTVATLASYTKQFDSRVLTTPSSQYAYWLRYDGVLFGINKQTGSYFHYNIPGDLGAYTVNDDAWRATYLTVDTITSRVYVVAYTYADATAPQMWAFDEQLNMLWNQTSNAGLFATGLIPVVNGDLLVSRFFGGNTLEVLASNGTSVFATTPDGNYYTRSSVLYDPTSKQALYGVYGVGYSYGWYTAQIWNTETRSLGWVLAPTTLNINALSPGHQIAVDSTGRISITGGDASAESIFSIWGCSFGSYVNSAGECEAGCPPLYDLIDNACVQTPPPAEPPVEAPTGGIGGGPTLAPSAASAVTASVCAMFAALLLVAATFAL